MLRPTLLIASLAIAALPAFAQVEDGRPLARFRIGGDGHRHVRRAEPARGDGRLHPARQD